MRARTRRRRAAAPSGEQTSPTTLAMSVTPRVMSTAPMMSKTTPERIIFVIGIIPEP